MKRIISIVLCSLIVLVVMAQSNRFEYWLDANYEQRQTGSCESDEYTFDLDIKGLNQGLHVLNLRSKTQDGSWGAPIRYLFPVSGMTEAPVKGIMDWIDDNYSGREKILFTKGNNVQYLNLDGLLKGIHVYNSQVLYADDSNGPLKRELFLISNHREDIRLKALEYWFDNETQAVQQQVEETPVELNIDVSLLSYGTHTFHCRLQDAKGYWSENYDYKFVIAQPMGINSQAVSDRQASPKAIYSIDGKRLPAQRNGFIIVILNSGTNKKVLFNK